MTFKSGGDFSGGNISGGGGTRGGLAIGGGLGGIVIVILGLVFGFDPSILSGGNSSGTGQQQLPGGSSHTASDLDRQLAACKTAEDANRSTVCRIKATTISVDRVWSNILGNRYQRPKTVLFSGSVQTKGCGGATSAVGPFYCPADRTAYFDVSFFDTMLKRMGGSNGPLAQEYVVAHEYGHHVQNLMGLSGRAQRDPKGADSGSVRMELQADCFAGVWAYHADKGPDAMLEPITQQQLSQVMQTAKAIGDDTIQEQAGRRVNSDGWTHGSAAQRERWFQTGYSDGNYRTCDTWTARSL